MTFTQTASGELSTYLLQDDSTGDGRADFAIEVHAYTTLGYLL